MLTGFEKLVEERIQQSMRNGDFRNLEGAGKPLKDDDFSRVPEELRLAYKILKNADCLPPEIELKKEILQTETLLEGIKDEQGRYKVIKKLNFLIMKLNATRRGSIKLDMPQRYEMKLVDKMAAGKS